jgi:hypothetical protein
VDVHRLGQDVPDGEARIERRVGILEDDLDPPLVRHELLLRHRQDVAALEDRLARGRLVQAHQRQADRRLARARLADEPSVLPLGSPNDTSFTASNLRRPKRPFARIEILAEVFHVEDDRIGR